MNLRAVIDANVFVSIIVFDLLMRHAEVGHFEPRWSLKITEEVHEALTNRLKKPWPKEKVKRLFSAANITFGAAMVEGEVDLAEFVEIDEGDRHVVSAAICGKAEIILTYNLRDFPVETLAKLGLRPMHPDEFLKELQESYKEDQISFAQEMARVRRLSDEDFLARLSKSCPQTAASLVESIKSPG